MPENSQLTPRIWRAPADWTRRVGPGPADRAVRQLDQAMLSALLWWLLAAGAFLVLALSASPPPPGCSGMSCLAGPEPLIVVGVVLGAPAVVLALLVDAVLIRLARNVIRPGILLGTVAAWATIGLGLGLLAAVAARA